MLTERPSLLHGLERNRNRWRAASGRRPELRAPESAPRSKTGLQYRHRMDPSTSHGGRPGVFDRIRARRHGRDHPRGMRPPTTGAICGGRASSSLTTTLRRGRRDAKPVAVDCRSNGAGRAAAREHGQDVAGRRQLQRRSCRVAACRRLGASPRPSCTTYLSAVGRLDSACAGHRAALRPGSVADVGARRSACRPHSASSSSRPAVSRAFR